VWRYNCIARSFRSGAKWSSDSQDGWVLIAKHYEHPSRALMLGSVACRCNFVTNLVLLYPLGEVWICTATAGHRLQHGAAALQGANTGQLKVFSGEPHHAYGRFHTIPPPPPHTSHPILTCFRMVQRGHLPRITRTNIGSQSMHFIYPHDYQYYQYLQSRQQCICVAACSFEIIAMNMTYSLLSTEGMYEVWQFNSPNGCN
jgi:hypothetical protein